MVQKDWNEEKEFDVGNQYHRLELQKKGYSHCTTKAIGIDDIQSFHSIFSRRVLRIEERRHCACRMQAWSAGTKDTTDEQQEGMRMTCTIQTQRGILSTYPPSLVRIPRL